MTATATSADFHRLLRAEFERDGYLVLPNVVPTCLRNDFEQAMAHCYTLQALKLRRIREADHGDIDVAVSVLEEVDVRAGYQALPLIAQSQGGRRFAAWDGWGQIAEQLLGIQPSWSVVTPPSPFVNLPGSQRLLYHWHSEAHYYPKRRSFLNFWTPLFRPKHAGNGTLVIARGSHLIDDLPFAEYQGYDDSDVGQANHFVQYEVPASFVADCEHVEVHAEPGDLVVFHRRTVHTSSRNLTDEPTYAAVCRAFDVRGDLTLSGNLAATPYGGDYGRPGMEPL